MVAATVYPPLTTAVARVLKNRTRMTVAAGSVYAGVAPNLTNVPAAPYIATLGGTGGVVPYCNIAVNVQNVLPTGQYVARIETPGQALLPWSAPVSATLGTLTSFPAMKAQVGNGAVMVVAPLGLENVVQWRDAPFNVSPAITLSSVDGADPLDLTLKTNKIDASTTQATVDWGDGTAPVTDTIANWTTGKSHSYAAPGTYAITCTAKDAGNAVRGISQLYTTLAGVYLTPSVDGSVARRVHVALTKSARAAWATGSIVWSDGTNTSTGPSTGTLTDFPHDYKAPATYQISFSSNTGLQASKFLAVA